MGPANILAPCLQVALGGSAFPTSPSSPPLRVLHLPPLEADGWGQYQAPMMAFPVTQQLSTAPARVPGLKKASVMSRKGDEKDSGWEEQLVTCTRTDKDGVTFWGSSGKGRGLVNLLRALFQTLFSVGIGTLARGGWP